MSATLIHGQRFLEGYASATINTMSHARSNDSNAAMSSTRYTHGHERAVLASHGVRTAADCAAYFLGELEPGMRLLDVGFGPGTITLDLAEAVAPGEVIGIENTDAPFATARANAAARGDDRTRFERGDVMALPFADDSFDVVHAHQVLQHLTDPVGALQEMYRVCKPGGFVVVRDADYAAMSWYPEYPEIEEWRGLYRAIARGNGAEPDAGRYLRSWAAAAGLRNVQVTSSNWCYATEAACAQWGESQSQRVGGETFRMQATSLGSSDEAVSAMGAAWQRWGAHPDAFFLIPNTEILARK